MYVSSFQHVCINFIDLPKKKEKKETDISLFIRHMGTCSGTLKAVNSNDILEVHMQLTHHLRIFVSFISSVRQITR